MADTAPPRDVNGGSGQARIGRQVIHAESQTLTVPEEAGEHSEVVFGEPVEADEDLLEDYDEETEEIDLVHCRVASIPALRLNRFPRVTRLCLRQNAISAIEFPPHFAPSLEELDLYDNVISHISGLQDLANLTSLDISFNKIKRIENLGHLKRVKDLYLLQNRISKIEGLEGLTEVRNLELGANRIRDIENLESLTGLEELWLGKNKITELKNLSTLQNLKILSIQSNRITAITNLSSLPHLEELYISHNILTEISGLDSNKSLRVLDVSNNKISTLSGLTHLPLLEEFWASSNQLSSFKEVEEQLGKGKEALETVYFEMNPLQLAQPALYRNKVRLALPTIRKIDASYVQ